MTESECAHQEKLDEEMKEFVSLLETWHLGGWAVGWDRARRRLGCCHCTDKKITLSYPLLGNEANTPEQRRETFLHELAHALDYTHHNVSGHGKSWRYWCQRVGAIAQRCASGTFLTSLESSYRYMLCHRETGEIVHKYLRKPRFKYPLKYLMQRGRPETLGKLVVLPYQEERENISDEKSLLF